MNQQERNHRYHLLHREQILERKRINYYANRKQRIKKVQLWAKQNPEKYKILKRKRITFRGKGISLTFIPRTGICSKCKKSVLKGEIKKTYLHHTQYDETNPLAHTIEVCLGCHNEEHYKLKQQIISPIDVTSIICPRCKSNRLWKRGIHHFIHWDALRLSCKDCKKEFSIKRQKEKLIAKI